MAEAVKGKKVGIDLTTGSVLKGLLVFTGPIVLANIIQQVYSLVDLMVIGQFMGSTGTVGISTGGEIADMVTPIATSFGAAGQIYIGQLAGAKEHGKLKTTTGTFISMMTILSVVLGLLTILFCGPLLRLLNCPAEAMGQARDYMILTAIGIPFIFGYNAVCGVLRGMGESKRPMLFIIIAAVVNIVLDIILVVPFHMEAAGTAIATTVSQLASCAAAFVYMYKRRESFGFSMRLSYFKIDRLAAKVILSLGIPQAARSMLVRVSMLYVNASVNTYGLVESATNSVGNKLQKFLEVFTTSFSQAASATVAQNLGAKKHERASQTVLYSFYTTMGIAAVTAAIILLWPKAVFGIFTTDPSVLEMGVTYLQILVIHLFLSALTSSYQAMVIGCGDAKLNFIIGVLDGVACKIGLGVLFAYGLGWGVYGFFWGTALSRLIPGIINMVFFYSGKWKKRKLLTES